MKLRLPGRVDVVGRSYRVNVEKHGLRNPELDERPYAGRSDHRKSVLTIDANRPIEDMRETLIHEILHSIDTRTADPDNKLAERDISRFSVGIDYVLSHNPGILSLYRKGTRK